MTNKITKFEIRMFKCVLYNFIKETLDNPVEIKSDLHKHARD